MIVSLGRQSYQHRRYDVSYPFPNRLSIAVQLVAKLAKVPTNNQSEFCKRLSESVTSIRRWDRRSTGEVPDGPLLQAADASRRLQDAFFRMNKRDRDWIEHFRQFEQRYLFAAGEIDDLGATISNIAMLLHAALGKPLPVPRHIAKRFRAKEQHITRDRMLRELVFELLSAAWDTDGKLTFNMNSGSGTLADSLCLLRDHLPEGLVTDPLHYRTIQRLKTEFLQLRASPIF
jgi:hypothetical protein